MAKDAIEDQARHPRGVDELTTRRETMTAGESEPLRTGEVRVVAVEAAVAAGLVKPPENPDLTEAMLEPDEDTATIELPDWTDPPTGQVPRVLLGDGEDPDAPRRRGPSWRQSAQDWDQDTDALEFLIEGDDEVADDSSAIAGRGSRGFAETDPFEFDFEPPKYGAHPEADEPSVSAVESNGAASGAPTDDAAWTDVVAGPAGHHHRHTRPGGHHVRPAPGKKRRTSVAIATGVVLAAVAVGCFASGPLGTAVLTTIALSLAAGETFGALRRSDYRPFSFFGIAATAALVVFAYLKGPIADPVVLAGLFALSGAVLVVRSRGRFPVEDLGVTVLVTTWVGLLGSFAGLLLNPTTFPHRHGVAFLGAVVGVTVAHDVGSYVVGAYVGRHRFAPRVSPGKTIEGLIGGTAFAFLVAGFLVARVHPFTLASALGVGAIVVVLAPIGDLVQSVVKRDLGLKDMGRLLPAHGGISDRIDAMLFVLPAAYIFFRLVHLG